MKSFFGVCFFLVFVLGFFYPEQADRVLHQASHGLSQLWWKGHIAILDIKKSARKAPCHKDHNDNDEVASFDGPDTR